MAYVSGIAGLGDPATLSQLERLTESAMLHFGRMKSLSELDEAFKRYNEGAHALYARLASGNEKAQGTSQIGKAAQSYQYWRKHLTPSTSTAKASTPTSTNLDTEFGTWITSLSPDTRQSVLKASDYDDLDRASAAAKASKPAEKSVFDAIGDVFSGVADAAKSLLPTALAVTKAQQERKQQEQLARLQAAGLLPQQQAPAGMSATTKVALGAGGALLLGFIIYKVATR